MLGCKLTLVLASCLAMAGASQVHAGCVPGGLKGMFCHTQTYAELASELAKATASDELKVNIEAASKLPDKPNVYAKLLTAFAALKDTEAEEAQLCSIENIANLRLLAQAMEAEGDLEPKEISEPIKRLNKMIIEIVTKARSVCFRYLASQWPEVWKEESNYIMVGSLSVWDDVPKTLLLSSHPDYKSNRDIMTHSVGYCSFVDEEYSREKVVSPILRPYTDLLISADIIDPKSKRLAKFYADPKVAIDLAPIEHTNEKVLTYAWRFRACEVAIEAREDKKSWFQ